MWLQTLAGFYSIVEKPEDASQDMLTVRARARADLDRLRADYIPELGPTAHTLDSDYAFRARAPKAAVASGIARLVGAIRYGNFKDAVLETRGYGRAQVYGRVWAALRALQPRTGAG
jgi:hypothetical protein